nr:MAG TPA: hypothetical protein [Caudoviricetes sp.]
MATIKGYIQLYAGRLLNRCRPYFLSREGKEPMS